jgi:hypothetical protein
MLDLSNVWEFRMNKKLINKIAEIDIKLNRGLNLFSSVKNAIYIGTALKLLFNLTILNAIFMCIIAMFCFFIIGHLDLKYIKLYQKEASLNTSKYNPFLNRIRKLK